MSSSKANRKDKDRRGDDDYSSSRRDHGKTKSMLDEFWMDGEGIDREVLQSSICRFLGAEATSRPAEHEGRRGFIIRAIRQFTPAMLQDLKELSADFRAEARSYSGSGNLSFGRSQTWRRHDDTDSDAMSLDPTYPPNLRHVSGVPSVPYTQGPNLPTYSSRYPQDSPVTYSMANPNADAQSYPSHPSTGAPSGQYMDNYYPSDSPYNMPYSQQAGQWPSHDQGVYGSARNPTMPPYSGYTNQPGGMPGGPNNYAAAQSQPRLFDPDPYRADPGFPRPTNQAGEYPYGPQGGAGPAAYGQNQRDPRDRDPRDIRDQREVRDARDPRGDYNTRPSSDYPPTSRRR